jgi:hypothetical protein
MSHLLGLAAAPTFATLALLSFMPEWGLPGGEAACGASAFNGMTVMYGLMALFHLPPWLNAAIMSSSGRRLWRSASR